MNLEQVSSNKVQVFLSLFKISHSKVQVKFNCVHSNFEINNITSNKKLNLEVR